MRGRLIFFNFIILVLVLAFMPRQAFTQADNACPPLVLQALQDLGESCADLTRNTACYGYNRVSALFNQDVADTFFSKPADRSDLAMLQSLDTAPLDTALNQWGVAVLSVQANIPDTLPGQSARFILLGDVSVQNDVPADENTNTPVEPVKVTTSAGANIRSQPTMRANILGSVPAGTDLQADALSADNNWLRVNYADTTVGWISRDVIQNADSASGLPVAGDEPRTPMQAFRLRTGIGPQSCEDAPSLLMVQGPQNVSINITANGADIQIGSTIVLTTGAGKFKLITVHGKAQVGGLVVPAGYSVEAPLDANGEISGNFGDFHLLTQDELDGLKTLENIPANVLNYPIKLPNVQIIQQQTQGNGNAPAAGKADCTPFRATSPLDGLAFGVNTFYWDAAPGATSYRVTVSGVGSVESTAPTTNANLDLTSVGFNPQMSWYVEALVNGQVACTSQTVTIAREAPPAVVSAPSFSASWSCVNPGLIDISFPNVPAGTTSVTINYSGVPHSPSSGTTISVPPFQVALSGTPGTTLTNGSIVAHPSGRSASLPSITC